MQKVLFEKNPCYRIFFVFYFLFTGGTRENQTFWSFQARKLTFRKKVVQFCTLFSKMSDIKPRSDKADLLGSTGNHHKTFNHKYCLLLIDFLSPSFSNCKKNIGMTKKFFNILELHFSALFSQLFLGRTRN